MGSFLGFIASVGAAIWMALTLDPSAAALTSVHPLTMSVAVTVALLAGASTLLGNSVVLFLNRVRGWRFVVTLVLNGVAMVALYVAQAVVIAVIGPLIAGYSPGFAVIVQGVLLATAPMVFGFLGLIPYAGPAITRVLQAWGVVVLWSIVAVTFQQGFLISGLITVLGWGVMQLLSWATSGPIGWAGDRIWQWVTGRPSMMTGSDLLSGHFFMPLDSGHTSQAGESS